MKRFSVALAAAVLTLFAGLAVASPAMADTNDFTITSFEADYYLDRDEAGRSSLRTVETIVAQFPDFDQNRGLLRYLVDDYQGHPTNISIESITDADGRDWPYESESSEGFVYLRIGDPDRYVQGSQTYVITYTSHNVTLFDGENEEFYWDVNGTAWPQSFGSVVGRVHIADELAENLTGQTRCYLGPEGSEQECGSPEPVDEDGGVVIEVSARDLPAYNNVSVAIGFEPGTFEPRDNSALASFFFIPQLIVAGFSVLLAIWALIRRASTFADARGRPTIVAEYLPPKNASPIVAGIATGRKKKAVAAQLISFAVSGAVRIIQAPDPGLFALGDQYTLELLDASKLDAEETRLAQIFFGSGLVPGTQYTIQKKDVGVGKAVYALIAGLERNRVNQGWRKKVPLASRFGPGFLAVSATTLAVVFGFFMLADERGGLTPVIVSLVSVIASIIVLAVVSRQPYSEKGAELRDYLRGLELYITVAESDRIQMLQSPDGAQKTAVDTTDRSQIVKLYERVLPFAVLFGQEKNWAKVLGEYYDEQPPEWYSGSTAFSSAVFASSIASIASSSSTAYSGSSSSSGGSGGGGSSGGGGGGGGGGGW